MPAHADPEPRPTTPAAASSVTAAEVPAPPRSLSEVPTRPLVVAGAGIGGLLVAAACALGSHGTPGRVPLFAVVVLAGLVFANGWTRVVALPSRKGTAIVAAFASLVTAGSVLLAPAGPALMWLPGALALAVVGSFLHQLLRTDARPRVVASLSGSLLAVAVLASGSCWIALAREPEGRAVGLAAGLALAVGALVEGLLQRSRVRNAVVLVPAALGGALGAVVVHLAHGPAWQGAVGGLLACLVAGSAHAMLAPLPALVARRAQLVSATAGLLASGAVVLVAARGLLA